MFTLDCNSLSAWFLNNKRALPWREGNDPYSIWISEVMLQQTQVSVVIPYFKKWMQCYPTIQRLAEANLDEVLKLWEGLGYYSRAKNLVKGAQFVMDFYQGVIPADSEKLLKIPGLGPYSVGAILSFGFQMKAPAVDGNVLRFITRYFAIKEDISSSKTQKTIREIVAEILPDQDPSTISEAMIELGAMICKKKAICAVCPVKTSCSAYRYNLEAELPFKKKQVGITRLERLVPIIFSNHGILIRKIPEGQIMGGLHEFPYFEEDDEATSSLKEEIKKKLNLEVTLSRQLKKISHSFTRYQATLTPYICFTNETKLILDYFWASKEDIGNLAFSSGHKKILNEITDLHCYINHHESQ